MKIQIENLGPVRSIEVDLAELTVFTGPNNSGKSVIATVLYAALDSMSDVPELLANGVNRSFDAGDVDLDEELGRYLAENRESLRLDELPSGVRNRLEQQVSRALELFGELVVNELARAYGEDLNTLRRRKSRPTKGSILIRSDRPAWSLRIELLNSGPRIKVENDPPFHELWDFSDDWIEAHGSTRHRRRDSNHVRNLRMTLESLLGMAFIEFPFDVVYLPAARSGIMQSQKVLAGSIIRQSSFAGAQDIEIPSLTGVVSDFLSLMITLETKRRSRLAGVAEHLENRILKGRIGVDRSEGGAQEYYYSNEAGKFPITRTSSMVSELAPIVLLLRHYLNPGDLLILEEPEAHLHPATQTDLARAIVRLLNMRLRVLVTTHSEFFLQQLSNTVAGAGTSATAIVEAGLDTQESLEGSRVSAYWFDTTDNGVRGRKLDVSAEHGIPEDSFGDVAEMLHEQSATLEMHREESA